MIITNIASIITAGVWILLILEIDVSIFVFLSVADSSNSNILATVEFSYKAVTFISITSFLLILPDNTLDDALTFTSSLSPVRAEVSSADSPLITTPSRGIFSPFFTINISPTFTSSTLTFCTSLSSFLLA